MSSLELERVVLAAQEKRFRIIGLTSPCPRSGTTTIAQGLARTFAMSGTRTLFADMSGSAAPMDIKPMWAPAIGGAGQAIERDLDGFDRLRARFDENGRMMFNNVALLRRTFGEDLAHYGAIIVDMPSLVKPHPGQVNAAAVAASCDGVYLVCVADVCTRSEIVQAAHVLKCVSTKLTGTIANDFSFPTLGAEVAREARRIYTLLPRVSSWIERKALASTFLN